MKKLILTVTTLFTLLCASLAFAQIHHQRISTDTQQATTAHDSEIFDAMETHNKKQKAVKEEQDNQDVFALISETEAKQQESGALFDPNNVKDPHEGFNRFIFKLNDRLDKAIAQPVAKAYDDVVPKPINHGVNNFFNNLENIPIFTNDLLQGKIYQATSDLWRFLINTTIGVGGLVDVAKHSGLEQNYNDFGLTLATWGWKHSSYLVIPILGPSTIRDAGGRAINFFALSAYSFIDNFYVRWGLYGFSLLNTRVQLLKAQGFFDRAALDPYIFARDAYLQHRAFLIEQNAKKKNPYTAEQTRAFNNPLYLYN